MKVTYIGGPTIILEIEGLRFITDPTLDKKGEFYNVGKVILEKIQSPTTTELGTIDYVLLSHDQHADNLDKAGRALLPLAKKTFTTPIAAERLGGNAVGMVNWQHETLDAPTGSQITITATPARHGPCGIEKHAGDVTGFLVTVSGKENYEVYITGDTVYYEGVAEVAKRFKPKYVFAFGGAAQTRGPFNLTMNVNDMIDTAHAFRYAVIVPLHFEGWKHYTQSGEHIQQSFETLGIGDKLLLLPKDRPIAL